MSNIALKAEGLVVQYGGVRAVDGVNITVRKGEICGLIGPNGAGKSTIIDAITGRRKPTAGTVHLNGQDVSSFGVIQRRQLGLSRSFQRTSIFPLMTVRAQVELAAVKVGAKNPIENTNEVLRQLELADIQHIPAGELGYGEQRRVDLALALVGEPQLLLLDEPMAGLTVEESLELADHLKLLASKWHVSVLLVEHDMDVIFGISDTVTVIELGKVIANGEPASVRADRRVREAYLGSAA